VATLSLVQDDTKHFYLRGQKQVDASDGHQRNLWCHLSYNWGDVRLVGVELQTVLRVLFEWNGIALLCAAEVVNCSSTEIRPLSFAERDAERRDADGVSLIYSWNKSRKSSQLNEPRSRVTWVEFALM